jgi:hypothetical protein
MREISELYPLEDSQEEMAKSSGPTNLFELSSSV